MVEEDDKKKDIELEHLGPLYYQKDEKTFIEQMNEIEKIVIAEVILYFIFNILLYLYVKFYSKYFIIGLKTLCWR